MQGKLKGEEAELSKTLKENRERAEKNSYLKRYYDHVKAQLSDRLGGLHVLRDIPDLDLELIDRDFDQFVDKLKTVVVDRFRSNDKSLYNILKSTVQDIRIIYTKWNMGDVSFYLLFLNVVRTSSLGTIRIVSYEKYNF